MLCGDSLRWWFDDIHTFQPKATHDDVVISNELSSFSVWRAQPRPNVCNNILWDLSKRIDDLSVELTQTRGEPTFKIHHSPPRAFYTVNVKDQFESIDKSLTKGEKKKGYRLFDSARDCWFSAPHRQKILSPKLNLSLVEQYWFCGSDRLAADVVLIFSPLFSPKYPRTKPSNNVKVESLFIWSTWSDCATQSALHSSIVGRQSEIRKHNRIEKLMLYRKILQHRSEIARPHRRHRLPSHEAK